MKSNVNGVKSMSYHNSMHSDDAIKAVKKVEKVRGVLDKTQTPVDHEYKISDSSLLNESEREELAKDLKHDLGISPKEAYEIMNSTPNKIKDNLLK